MLLFHMKTSVVISFEYSVIISYEDICYHSLTDIKARELQYFFYKMASVQVVL